MYVCMYVVIVQVYVRTYVQVHIIVTFLLLLCNFLRWDIVLSQAFFWKTLRGPVGTLSAVRGVRVTPVARVMAAESCRSWLYFAGYQFRKN